ncbi:hypothetical protein BCR34DRAFT_576425 [Clohesyomyces aquaticus]|uniref:Secreted protein n=1 Tax=Clohesyomyces aquaticus TaxID=1231657 RepID=A0A1Y1YPW2_9PLEO|nr:hypothetical protein BCR34DRAFT_576425 [Clohesyomyces aquaticus]
MLSTHILSCLVYALMAYKLFPEHYSRWPTFLTKPICDKLLTVPIKPLSCLISAPPHSAPVPHLSPLNHQGWYDAEPRRIHQIARGPVPENPQF